MKILKYSVNVVLSFIIVFAIILVIAVNIVNNKALNKEYIFSKMEETEFYLQISREVESGFENYIYQSGFPEETIKNLFTEDMIKKDANSLINFLYDGTEIKLSSEILRTNLEKKIQDYIKSENMTLTEQNIQNIDKFKNLIIGEYDKNIKVSDTLYEKGHEIIEIVKKISEKIGNLPIIILFILIIVLIIINKKDLLLVINFLGISLLTIGILFKIGVNTIFANVEIDNLMIMTKSLSNLIISIIKENLYLISDYGNIFIISGITGILVYSISINLKPIEEKIRKPKRRFAGNKNI